MELAEVGELLSEGISLLAATEETVAELCRRLKKGILRLGRR
jgi:hypothetical protein